MMSPDPPLQLLAAEEPAVPEDPRLKCRRTTLWGGQPQGAVAKAGVVASVAPVAPHSRQGGLCKSPPRHASNGPALSGSSLPVSLLVALG